MKWIGQHIYDQVSRFRAKVYVEDDLEITGSITSTDDLAIVATGNDITVDSDTFQITSSTANRPQLDVKSTANDADSPMIRLWKTRNDGSGTLLAGVNNDGCGEIQFNSVNNNSPTPSGQNYGKIECFIDERTENQESGQLKLQVSAHDGDLENGLLLTGGSVDAEVDVTIANGVASVTTIAGDLTVTGDVVMMANLPTSDPSNAGQLWNDSNTLKISAG